MCGFPSQKKSLSGERFIAYTKVSMCANHNCHPPLRLREEESGVVVDRESWCAITSFEVQVAGSVPDTNFTSVKKIPNRIKLCDLVEEKKIAR